MNLWQTWRYFWSGDLFLPVLSPVFSLNYFLIWWPFSVSFESSVFKITFSLVTFFCQSFESSVFFKLLLIWWPFFLPEFSVQCLNYFWFGDPFSVRVLSPVFSLNYFWFGDLFFFLSVLSPVGFLKKITFDLVDFFPARGLSPGFSLNYFWWPFSCQSFEASVFFKLLLIRWPFSCQSFESSVLNSFWFGDLFFLVRVLSPVFSLNYFWFGDFFQSEFWVQCWDLWHRKALQH